MSNFSTKTIIFLAFILFTISSKAQTAMDFNRKDCAGTMRSCFGDLDAGKVVILHFFMPGSCASCPPPAKRMQAMANNILANHPNSISAYAFPFNDVTTCSTASSWVSTNGLSLYSAMDSGALLVANYGGFGMPTVVVLGGKDHRVLYASQTFTSSDTIAIKDSILAVFKTTGVTEISENIPSFTVFPNPTNSICNIQLELKNSCNLTLELFDIAGNFITTIADTKASNGNYLHALNTSELASGLYTIRVKSNGEILNRKLNVTH